MTLPAVTLKPGPMRIAAAMALAGFAPHFAYPTVTDVPGRVFVRPSALLIATAIGGAEASAHAWVWNVNHPTSLGIDWGLMEINSLWHPEHFGPITNPTQLNWANYADNAVMGFSVWKAARAGRLAKDAAPGAAAKGRPGPMSEDFAPWNAYSSGHYLKVRHNNRSWIAWAQYGVDQMNAAVAAGRTLAEIASVDLDPLVYP